MCPLTFNRWLLYFHYTSIARSQTLHPREKPPPTRAHDKHEIRNSFVRTPSYANPAWSFGVHVSRDARGPATRVKIPMHVHININHVDASMDSDPPAELSRSLCISLSLSPVYPERILIPNLSKQANLLNSMLKYFCCTLIGLQNRQIKVNVADSTQFTPTGTTVHHTTTARVAEVLCIHWNYLGILPCRTSCPTAFLSRLR